MSMYSYMASLREHHETAKVGMRWTNEEDEELMVRVKDKMELCEIARIHQRTMGGIKSRIIHNGWKMVKEGKLSVEEVTDLLNVSVEDIKKYNEKQEKKITQIRVKRGLDPKEPRELQRMIDPEESRGLQHTVDPKEPRELQHMISILEEIRDYLKVIVDDLRCNSLDSSSPSK
jgi:polyhydroxyalkanoate synthesis regulator phasin